MTGPGKFEGEPEWLESMWEEISGLADPENEFTTGEGFFVAVELLPEDKEKWPNVSEEFGVILSEDSQGFVHAELYADEKDFREAVEELQEVQTEYLGDDE